MRMGEGFRLSFLFRVRLAIWHNTAMLLILTGDIQTGKTRWLERSIAELAARGVQVEGVLAPGVWRINKNASADAPAAERFEKLGIDNVLLPEGRRIRFALRRDLAECADEVNNCSQSSRAQLGWEIFEDALAEVNRHCAELRRNAPALQSIGTSDAPRLLVIDELGRLELERDGGLTEAITLLEEGPLHINHHALIVVRNTLADTAMGRFAHIWGEAQFIAPGDDTLMSIFG